VLHVLLILTSFQEPLPTSPEPSRFSIEGELMGRAEFRDHGDLSTPDSESADVARLRGALGLRMKLGNYVSGFGEVIASWGNTEEHQTEAVLNLYMDFHRLLGAWDLRAGRSEVNLGDGRLVASSRNWLFEPNAFDGVFVSDVSSYEDFNWRGWFTTAGLGPADVEEDTFAGLYADWQIDKDESAELYALLRDQSDLHVTEFTLAVRWFGQTRHGLDWSVFGAAQDGEQINNRETWGQAFVLTLGKELEFDNHLGFEFGFATGNDEKAHDFKRFTPVYIDQHRFNGRADLFGFANLVDFAFTYWRPWSRNWSLHADLHNFWRANKADDAYTAYSLEPYGITNASSALGSELDLYTEGRINESLSLDVGAAYYMSGSAMPTDDDQIWFFASAVYGF
jgi:hypothetical protein